MPAADSIMPFEEAIRLLQQRGVLPTNLTSAQLRQLGDTFHRQNFTSARTALEDLLTQYKADVEKIVNPQTVIRDGQPVTQGLDLAQARVNARNLMTRLGLDMNDGSGPITDITSRARMNLVLQTNRDTMRGAGQFLQSQSDESLAASPCWELFRLKQPRTGIGRDWKSRFLIAAEQAGDFDAIRVLKETGRMIARKDSPLWQLLGDGPPGSTDGLGNPYPPFAFNSGMDVRDVGYRESIALGFITPGQQVQRTLPDDLAQLFGLAA